MKFMVTGLPGAISVPPGQGMSLYKAAVAWFEERLKNGMIECHYVFPDQGGFAISNASSPEELFNELLSYPLYPFFSWEVKALCDWKQSYDTIIKIFEKTMAP